MKRCVTVSFIHSFGDVNAIQAGGEPYAVKSLDEYQVLVSSRKHINEFSSCLEDHLSFHAAMEDVSHSLLLS